MTRKRRSDHVLRQKSHKEYYQYNDEKDDERHDTETTDETSIVEHSHVCFFTSGVLLAVYVATLYPSVPGGDSGELINAGHELGVPHPPGYPVFTIATKLAMIIIPFKSIAWRVHFMNAVFSAAAGGFLQLAVLKLTNDFGSSVFAVGLFCLSKVTWTYSVHAEVFSLNNLMIGVLMYLAVMFEKTLKENEDTEDGKQQIRKVVYVGVLLCGFALCNQHTIVLYVGVIAVWVLISLIRLKMLSFKMLAMIGVCFAIGLLPYAFLPISSYINASKWTWGDQTTMGGFLRHLLRSEYGTFDLGKGSEGKGFVANLIAYFEHSQRNLCTIGPLLAVAGSLSSVFHYSGKLGEGSLFVFISMLSVYVSFFSWRANLDVSDSLMAGVVERFFMQSDMVLVLLAAVGLSALTKLVTRTILGESKVSMASAFTCVAALSILGIQMQNFSACNQSNNYVVHDFAKTMLNNLPKNAIVLTKGDLPTNTFRYLTLCENMRPDVTLLDTEILTYEWSLPKVRQFYPHITFPGDIWHTVLGHWADGRTHFNLKMFLDANYHKGEVFACIGMNDQDVSWKEGYTLIPFGPCHKVMKNTEPLNVREWTKRVKHYASEWKYPFDTYDAKSWEKVANDEMWNAKINYGFFMYAESQETQDGKMKAEMLLAAHEIYLDAIKVNQPKGSIGSGGERFPYYWHKNFALVCERLLYVDIKMSKASLCRTSIYHFELYIASKPQDEDISRIRDAVENLRSRIDTYQKLDSIEDNFGKKIAD